jgi:hypothetical protein
MMKPGLLKFLIILFFLSGNMLLAGQVVDVPDEELIVPPDTVKPVLPLPKQKIKGEPAPDTACQCPIVLNRDEALQFLRRIGSSNYIWKQGNDPFREAIRNLVHFASTPREDSVVSYLSEYGYDKIKIPLDSYFVYDSLRIILPVMEPDSVPADSSAVAGQAGEMFIEAGNRMNKVKLSADASPVIKNDTLLLNDTVFVLVKDLVPALIPRKTNDTIILVITDTLPEVTLYRDDFPFRHIKNPYVSDSIIAAVSSLIGYLEARDSTLVSLVSDRGRGTDMWLNSRADNLVRFWLPDGENDSVSVWIGSPERNTLSLKAEEGVLFKKQTWHDRYVDTRVNVISAAEENLRRVALSRIKPDYWKFKTDISYLLSQGAISNWAKGGENNISSVLDVESALNYNNKETNVNSSTTARFALGLQASGKYEGIRKNLDILEINSKINSKAFGKFDLSGLFQFKSQFMPGYNYPNDSVKVSRFFNPATFIFGYGLEYKPDKNTSISFSPISYKGTFVPDTSINQTKFGIPEDKRSKNELGAYLTIRSKLKLFDRVDMNNKIQLFSNFISEPQNIDIDWEMIATTSLNWFTDLRLNVHLIYDDNTLLPLFENGEPVLGTDGNQKMAPMVQFKELLGVSFVFKF